MVIVVWVGGNDIWRGKEICFLGRGGGGGKRSELDEILERVSSFDVLLLAIQKRTLVLSKVYKKILENSHLSKLAPWCNNWDWFEAINDCLSALIVFTEEVMGTSEFEGEGTREVCMAGDGREGFESSKVPPTIKVTESRSSSLEESSRSRRYLMLSEKKPNLKDISTMEFLYENKIMKKYKKI